MIGTTIYQDARFGNDFVVIDNRSQQLELREDEIKLICDRHYGIGCDQLVVINSNNKKDIQLTLFFGIQMDRFLPLVAMRQGV